MENDGVEDFPATGADEGIRGDVRNEAGLADDFGMIAAAFTVVG